jgi:hypothetical protein
MGDSVMLVSLINEDGEVINKMGKAIVCMGCFDEDGNEYCGGVDNQGVIWASFVDTDNTVMTINGNRTKYNVGEKYNA